MLKHQRNSAMNYLNNINEDDYVLVSDVDEIPKPSKILDFINSKHTIGVFEQLMFYYKLNILNETSLFGMEAKFVNLNILESGMAKSLQT